MLSSGEFWGGVDPTNPMEEEAARKGAGLTLLVYVVLAAIAIIPAVFEKTENATVNKQTENYTNAVDTLHNRVMDTVNIKQK